MNNPQMAAWLATAILMAAVMRPPGADGVVASDIRPRPRMDGGAVAQFEGIGVA